MRLTGEVCRARCRQAAAGMVLAGAAMIGWCGAVPARAAPARNGEDPTVSLSTQEELAFAVPRLPAGTADGEVALPHPLPAIDAARIRQIFAFQAAGDLAGAARVTAALGDRTLLGDVLADRYLGTGARPSAAVLAAWLRGYGDQWEAPAVRDALARLRKGIASAPAATGADPLDDADAAAGGTALHAESRVDAARALLARGALREALLAGRDALARSNGAAGAGGFVAGLAAWRLGRLSDAGTLFDAAERARCASGATRAAAAFWVARTRLASGDGPGYRAALLRAAHERGTFYGMLAARRLGYTDWAPAPGPDGTPVLGAIDVEAIGAIPAGRRAFALLQVGEPERAEATLRHLWPTVSSDRALLRSLMLVADAAGMTDLAASLASALDDGHAVASIALGLRMPTLHPDGGFTVDPALVYALARVESDFDAGAVSGAGAHGLMQLEPVTAGYVIGDADRFTAHPARLHDASLNLQLGQRYVGFLAASTHVDGDLIHLLAAYNAGPNRITDWDNGAEPGNGDPLMFIEAIPSAETRGFVHRSLAFLWIYAARLRLPSPSLDALAAGIWPSYAPEVALGGAPISMH